MGAGDGGRRGLVVCARVGEGGNPEISTHDTTTKSKDGEEKERKKNKSKKEWRLKICSPEIKGVDFFPL